MWFHSVKHWCTHFENPAGTSWTALLNVLFLPVGFSTWFWDILCQRSYKETEASCNWMVTHLSHTFMSELLEIAEWYPFEELYHGNWFSISTQLKENRLILQNGQHLLRQHLCRKRTKIPLIKPRDYVQIDVIDVNWHTRNQATEQCWKSLQNHRTSP